MTLKVGRSSFALPLEGNISMLLPYKFSLNLWCIIIVIELGLKNTVIAKSMRVWKTDSLWSNNIVRIRVQEQKCLKTASDGADVTWAGRSFQTAAPETGNVRLPTVERRASSMWRRSEQDEHSRRRNGIFATRVKQDWIYHGPAPWIARYVKTDNLNEMCSGTRSQWRLMSTGVMCLERRIPLGGILYRLETPDQGQRQTIQRTVYTVI